MLPRRSDPGAGRRLSFSFVNLLSRLFFSWETQAFNKLLYHWGQRYSSFLKLWFSLGVGFGVTSMIIVSLMLFWAASSLLVEWDNQRAVTGILPERQLVTFVVPGVNVPWSDLPYILAAMTFAVGFHELGHAVAATSEGVHIEHIAVFLACLVPGALVALNDDSLRLLSPLRALRIYCAGIWHNGLCCVGCYLLLVLLPVILRPLYLHSKNPLVLSVSAKSPLAGHLSPGNSILEVDGIQLHNPEDWGQHLHALHFQELSHLADTTEVNGSDLVREESRSIGTKGFCIPTQNLIAYESRMTGSSCSDNELPFLELPCTVTFLKGEAKPASSVPQTAFCLKARDVVEYPMCGKISRLESSSDLCSCSENTTCLGPVLHEGEMLINIKIGSLEGCPSEITNASRGSCEQSIIFVGDPGAIVYTIHLTNYWPRHISVFGLASVSLWQWLPDMVEKLLTYTLCISAAMVLLNGAPVFYLDGEAMLQSWLSLSRAYVHPRKRRQILHIVLTVGSILLVIFMASGLLSMGL